MSIQILFENLYNKYMEHISEQYITDFLNTHLYGILSTVNPDNQPDAAPIHYVQDDLFQLLFVTPKNTQKYTNISNNAEIVLTVTDEKELQTVQIRGHVIEEENELKDTLSKLGKKLSDAKGKLVTLPLFKLEESDKASFRLIPSEVRMRSFKGKKVRELTINDL